MQKKKLQHFKKLLLEERKDILNTINLMNSNEPNDSMRENFNELSMYDNHPADLGTEMYMIEQNASLKDNEKITLSEVENALIKIENGTYGQCEMCGKQIDLDRLELLPHTSICINCAENKKVIDKRPKEELKLSIPFSRTFTDVSEKESVVFDGEDSWQAVARFNMVPNDPSNTTMDNMGIFDDEEEQGIVESVDRISEEYYKDQIN